MGLRLLMGTIGVSLAGINVFILMTAQSFHVIFPVVISSLIAAVAIGLAFEDY